MDATNIASHLPLMAAKQPDTLAVAVQTKSTDFPRYTYSQLNLASDELAKGLQERGVVKGTRTVLMVKPGLDFFALVFALFKLGAVLVAVDPGMGRKNLKQCLADAQPQAFIGSRSAHLARLCLGWAKQSIQINIVVEAARLLGHFMPNLDAVRKTARQSALSSSSETAANDMAAILFTSGSTGVPKGVIYTHANFNAQLAAIRDLYQIEAGEIDLATFPLFALFAPALGMTSIIPDMDFTRPGSVEPENIFAAIDEFKPTTMFASPALLNQVGRSVIYYEKKFPSLKRVLSAGAPVSAAILKKFGQALSDGVEIYTPYGATEALPVCSIGSGQVLSETSELTKQGKGVCVGKPVASVELHIIRTSDAVIERWQDDLRLENNEIGEIVVQGAQVTAAYFNRDESTALAKIADSKGNFYHRMGDLAYLDGQGRVWFCGRKSHRVESDGQAYHSVCCEGIFNTHEKVFRTALIPITIAGNIIPAVCVELAAGLKKVDTGLVVAELLEIGGRYQQTAAIKYFFFHRRFPVDIRHNAKIGRKKLALWAQGKIR